MSNKKNLSKTTNSKKTRLSEIKSCKDQSLSQKLWLPHNQNIRQEPLNLNTDKQLNNSWFSAEKVVSITEPDLDLQQIYTSMNYNENESETRIKIYSLKLTPSFKSKLRKAIFVTRDIYNKCVELCFREVDPYPITLKALRAALTTNSSATNIFSREKKADYETVPQNIRDEAIRDFVKSYKTNLALIRDGHIKSFEMKFRRRKDMIQESIVIGKTKFGNDKNGRLLPYSKFWDKEALESYNEVIPVPLHDSRLIMRTSGKTEKFYLAVPIDKKVITKEQTGKIASLDPGVRIFQTIYDNQGNSYMIGTNNDIEKLDRLSRAAERMRKGIKRDRLFDGHVLNKKSVNLLKEDGHFYVALKDSNKSTKSEAPKFVFRAAKNYKERKSLLKAAKSMENKIRNKVSDIHRKTVKFLCDNYDTVIIPKFDTQRMVNNQNYDRTINGSTTRRLIKWSHFKFRQLLIAKGAVTGTNIIVGTEERTTKTCGNCSYYNEHLKGEKVLICRECGCEIHRDINAARNIMILNWKRI
jgi:transposase